MAASKPSAVATFPEIAQNKNFAFELKDVRSISIEAIKEEKNGLHRYVAL